MTRPPRPTTQRREAGMRTRREVLGDAHVDRAVADTTPFTADFQDFITRTAWGDLWQRPGPGPARPQPADAGDHRSRCGTGTSSRCTCGRRRTTG